MTLQELWMVIVRRWTLVVALPIVCVLGCGVWLLFSGSNSMSYTATAYVVGNSQVTGVAGLAGAEIRHLPDKYSDAEIVISAKGDSATSTVTITATGPDEWLCIEAVNKVATATKKAAEKAFEDWETPYSGSVEKATETKFSEGLDGGPKYLLVALLAGLFVAICIVVVLDMRKRPVKTPEGVQEAVELPVLEIMPAKNGERLLANVRFATASAKGSAESGGESAAPLSSVLVVPAGDEESAQTACDLLDTAVSAEGGTLDVRKAKPLSQDMAGAYASQGADAVVVTARQWTDSLPQLESTVAELRLAGANLVGVAFAREKIA